SIVFHAFTSPVFGNPSFCVLRTRRIAHETASSFVWQIFSNRLCNECFAGGCRRGTGHYGFVSICQPITARSFAVGQPWSRDAGNGGGANEFNSIRAGTQHFQLVRRRWRPLVAPSIHCPECGQYSESIYPGLR